MTMTTSDDGQGVEGLSKALQFPNAIFGAMADEDLEARCEDAAWDKVPDELRRVLAHHHASADYVLLILKRAARFARRHSLRLAGPPWLDITCVDDVAAGAMYVVPLDMSPKKSLVWDERFLTRLADQDLLKGFFMVSFCGRSEA
ncbi:hypothetical protein [Roseateles chitosanitabidus]|uniref:hypothetical protein n=1 Tax=Roseateles chitosanitabidus TaxID=65048 RepID=UPI0011DF8B0C|nr:hypothetical protein [Roseateles chitosanitabidus]